MSEFADNYGAVPIGEAELEELATLRRERWRDEAIAAHPAAAPFRDLLVAPSAEAMRELAEDLASRVQGSGAAATPAGAGSVYVPAGSPALPPQMNDEEELDQLKREARQSGDWTNILRKMRERAVERAQRGF